MTRLPKVGGGFRLLTGQNETKSFVILGREWNRANQHLCSSYHTHPPSIHQAHHGRI